MTIYNQHKDIFLDFISKTNQKEIISDTVLEIIHKHNQNEKIIITDIGAGNGLITTKIINSIQNLYNFTYNFIEPSNELIKEFKRGCQINDVNILNERIENINIPESDIFILSFVLQLIGNKEIFLDNLFDKLKNKGSIIIINQNINSVDNIIKNILGKTGFDLTYHLINYLNKNNISYLYKTKTSFFDGYFDIINLTERGKNYISLLSLVDYNLISKNKLEEIIETIKINTINGKIIRKEDYIIINKHE